MIIPIEGLTLVSTRYYSTLPFGMRFVIAGIILAMIFCVIFGLIKIIDFETKYDTIKVILAIIALSLICYGGGYLIHTITNHYKYPEYVCHMDAYVDTKTLYTYYDHVRNHGDILVIRLKPEISK